MPLSARRFAKAQCLSIILLVALSRDVVAQPDERDALIQQLQQRIQALEKELLIQELRQRMETLEKKLEQQRAPPPPPVAAPPVPQPAAPAPKPGASEEGGPAPKPPAAAAPRPPASAPKPSASEEAGREDEGGRALERALVREGGVVLPPGVIEVDPRLQYTYRRTQGLNVVTVGGVALVAQQDLRRNDVEASVGVRAGLPASFQVEARLPYVWIDENRVVSSAVSQPERVSGRGDVELGVSKQLTAGRRGGLFASLLWKSVSGHQELGRLSPGSAFPQLQAALTAVRREDPLVFFGTVSYSRVFKREVSGSDVDPGDAIGLKAGTLLAASPENSLRASLELSRASRTRIAGIDVPGSDTTVGILEVGLSRVLTRRTLLDIQFGIGLTPDAPDFRLRIAVPIRFGP